MSPAELYEVYYSSQEIVNQLLQFQITISFAVVVAAHLASDRLTGFLYCVIAALYTTTLSVLTVRMHIHVEKAKEVLNRLVEHGEYFVDFSTFLPIAATLSGVLIFTSTIGFLIYGYVKRGAT
jgi:hypothetical protein